MDKNTVEVKQLSVHSYIKKAFRWDLKEDTECKSLKCIYILENNEKCFGAEAKNTVSDVLSRTCWGREHVRRFRVSSTWKRRAVKPGRRSTFSSAAPDSTAPPKAPPRSESQVRCVFFFFTAFSRSQRISAVLPTFDESCLRVFQEPRHLQYVADLDDLNVYAVVNGRKLYGAPADFTFCIKVTASSQTPTGRSVTVILAAHWVSIVHTNCRM